MAITRTSLQNPSKKEQYQLTKTSGVNVKDIPDGSVFPVLAWALYTETNSKGVEQEVLAVLTPADKLVTISATFKAAFFEVVELMGADDYSIVVKHGTTKNGREYVTCELDCT